MKANKLKGISVTALALAIGLGGAARAVSVNEPSGINLGGTSFMDGFGTLEPGFIYQQYFQPQHFNAINDTTGHGIGAFQGTSITAVVSVNQLIYVSPLKLFGGALGLTALQPIADLNAAFDHDSPAKLVANRGLGVGDLTWGPFLQMPMVMRGGRPVFQTRFELDVISPTGSYDTSKDINAGAGFWSINPYWSFTVLPTPNTELSARLHYLHNFTNTQPASSEPLPAGTNTQAGDAAWANFTASYQVLPGLRLGLNGYVFKQFTDDKVDGVIQKGTETENIGLGPGGMYALNHSNLFFANLYLPVLKKNTTSGFNTVFRWVHVF